MRRPHKEIQIAEVCLDRHFITILLFSENHSALCKIDPNVDDISREELEALNTPDYTTLG